MKLILSIGLVVLLISGCAMQPRTPEEQVYRLQLMGAMMQSRYQLPPPRPLSVPQTRIINVNCNTAGVVTSCTAQ